MSIHSQVLESGNPLALVGEDYESAEITAVYLRTDKNHRELVLGVVELLPPSIERRPDVPSARDVSCIRLPGSGPELNLRRIHLSPTEGLSWYEACRAGTVLVPTVDPAERFVLAANPFDEEPPAPLFMFEMGPFWEEAPFWGTRPGGSRWRYLLADGRPSTLTSLKPPQLAAAKEWLSDRLYIDLLARPAFWGSVHLRLPNPVLRSVNQTLFDGGIQLALLPHPGHTDDLKRLWVYVSELRSRGPSLLERFDVHDSHIKVYFPSEPHQVRVDVVCPRRGLLYSSEPAAFLKSINLNMGISSGIRQVRVPARSGKVPAETYTVPIVGYEQRHPPARSHSALAATVADKEAVRLRRDAERLGLRVFRGDRDEAKLFVREVIGRARSKVLIADPYFGPIELLSFGLANAVRGVTLRVLTSAEHLKNAYDARSNALAMVDLLQDIKTKDPAADIDIQVGNATSPIHDRFIIVDDQVWLLGSSLNAFGERGTVAVRIAYPDTVCSMIDEAMSNAVDLAGFVTALPPRKSP